MPVPCLARAIKVASDKEKEGKRHLDISEGNFLFFCFLSFYSPFIFNTLLYFFGKCLNTPYLIFVSFHRNVSF